MLFVSLFFEKNLSKKIKIYKLDIRGLKFLQTGWKIIKKTVFIMKH